ncbi:MAG: ADP-ribosylglycohydrolase family protein, partial [Hyphomicrobiales bacterium]
NGNAWKAGLISANLYDDTDTIGAIAAGMAGALNGASSLPKDKIELVITTNSLNLDTIVKQLLKIRNARQSPTLERAI